MKIKQTFFGLMGLMFLASSCQTNTDNIQGHLEGIGNDSLMVIQRYPGVRENSVDTIAALNGKFSINLKDSALSFVTIMELPKPNQAMRMMSAGNSIILLPGNKLKISGSMDSMVIAGSDFYKEYNDFTALKPIEAQQKEAIAEYQSAMGKNMASDSLQKSFRDKMDVLAAKQQEIVVEYITSHPDTDLAAYLFSMRGMQVVEATETILGEKAKNGPFKNLVDQALTNLENAKKIAEAKSRLQPGMPAPDFTLKNEEGKDVTLSSFKGKYVVLDYWGTWCSWCIKGFPEMKKYYAKYKKQMEIIGIDCRDTEDKWKKGIKEYDIPWVNVFAGNDDGITNLYAVSGFPTKVIIDPQGNIVKTVVGESPEFYELLDELMGGKKKK